MNEMKNVLILNFNSIKILPEYSSRVPIQYMKLLNLSRLPGPIRAKRNRPNPCRSVIRGRTNQSLLRAHVYTKLYQII